MHTAYEFTGDMFSIRCEGAEASRDAILDWDVRDRLGLVVNAPLGGLGAGLLTMLAITAFYDEPSRSRRRRPIYPDIYIFHVGGPWGSHGGFDFWPDRKDVKVAADAADVLRAINDRGITHLVVPDGPRRKVLHRYKEPEAAIDRVKRCFAYDPLGRASGSDVSIVARADGVLKTFETALRPQSMLVRMATQVVRDPSLRDGTAAGDDARRAIAHGQARLHEIDREGREARAVTQRLAAARDGDGLEEHLRRIDVRAALEMLGPRAGPAGAPGS